MADKTASKDIVVENIHGQQVVVVHKGQDLPDNVDELKERAAAGVVRQASEEEIDQSRGYPVQDKAKKGSRN